MEPSRNRLVDYWPANDTGEAHSALIIKVNRPQHGETRPSVDLQVFWQDGRIEHVKNVHGPDSDLDRNNVRDRWAWPVIIKDDVS
jgi:hypothetical protein